MATFTAATAISPTRIRLDFSAPLDRTNALEILDSYLLVNTTIATPVPRILSVFVPSLDDILYVELRVANMKEGAGYGVTVNPSTADTLITADGVAVPLQFRAFAGVGSAPEILLVIANSPNQITVHFSEPILDFGSARDANSWALSGGLTISSIQDVGKTTVVMKTSTQTPDTIYTLTFNGILFDYYNNPLVSPSVSQWLGWIEPTPGEPDFRLPQVYNFLFEGIRIQDRNSGELLRRYFDGFQTVWGAIVELIYLLKLSKDPTKLSGEQLRYLANLIGWSEKFRTILDAIDDPKLRSLVAISPQFWKDRGSPDADDGLIGLLTGARRYTLDWFDVRTIIDEMEISEEHEGEDPWMTSVPGDGSEEGDAYEYNLRIVDDGTLNRALVRTAARLSRPINERVLITYLNFLDLFEVSGDATQWTTLVGSAPSVAGGEFVLNNGAAQMVVVSTDFATDWKDYIVSWRLRSVALVAVDLAFRATDAANMFFIRVIPESFGVGEVHLYKVDGGITTLLSAFTFPAGQVVMGNVNHTWRVLVTNQLAFVHIECFCDGVRAFAWDEAVAGGSIYTHGTIAASQPGGANLRIEEVEVLRLPVESDYIDINSELL